SVHLIISDKSMPKMRGIELLKEVRTIDKDVPFFILTGYTTKEDDELLVQEGVTKILMKPLSLKEIVREIKEILNPGD
ncbi:MAG: response regulator, partial [Halobacteriovoraceae bacterium]|nr:response regulator [Halobacteriovoraceae bacterium]